RYEWLVTNKEEDVYVNGILDRTKLVGYGIADSNNYRQSINGLAIRVLYFDAEKDFLGYGTKTGKTIDAYNANNANYVNMYELSVTPIVSALVYPKLEMEADVLTTARWGAKVTL